MTYRRTADDVANNLDEQLNAFRSYCSQITTLPIEWRQDYVSILRMIRHAVMNSYTRLLEDLQHGTI